ncbi:MAG: cytochrome c oxidase assembly factor Coa1 family protein [Archangium sp.]|nr:cytochrome c oxidase assembly factor Coa1 family protein [Archangium sp.]
MTPNANAEPPMQQPGWFSRNWKWLLPVGCVVPLMCCGVFGLGTYFAASKMIEGSGAFAEAFAKASQNEEVTAALGAPITPGFGMSGEIKQNNDHGTADFTVPLKGSKGSGSMHVVARQRGGVWQFETIDVEAGGKTINVLAGSAKEPPPENDPPPDAEEPPPEEPDGD